MRKVKKKLSSHLFRNTEKRRLSPGRLIRVFKVSRVTLTFTTLFGVELPDDSLSKGFPWACRRTGWETNGACPLNTMAICQLRWKLLQMGLQMCERLRQGAAERDNLITGCRGFTQEGVRHCPLAAFGCPWGLPDSYHRNFDLSLLQEQAWHFSGNQPAQNMVGFLILPAAAEMEEGCRWTFLCSFWFCPYRDTVKRDESSWDLI